MKKFIKVLKTVIPFLIGAVFGAAVFYVGDIASGIEGGFLSVVITLAALYAGIIFHSIIHEAGHLIAGKLSGYDFLSFRVFNITLVKKDGKIQRKKYTVAGTGGQCLMVPPDYECETYPFVFYNLGGSLMNFIFSAVFFTLMMVTSGYAAMVFAVFAVIGAGIGVLNILPMKIGGVANDGYNIVLCVKNEKSRRALWTQLHIAALLSQGTRFREMPEDWFAETDAESLNDPLVGAVANMRFGYLTDIGEYTRACDYARFLICNCDKILEVHKNELRCELLFFEIIGQCRKEEIERLYDSKLQKYVKATLSYMSRQRLMCAYYALYQKDDAKAQKALSDFEKAALHTPFPGEAAGEREMLGIILNKKERSSCQDQQQKQN